MSLPVPESPLKIESGSKTQTELGKLATEIMPKASLGKLAEKATESAEKMLGGVEKIVKNLSPNELAALAALTVGTLIFLAPGSDNKKDEAKKEQGTAKPEKSEPVAKTAPVKTEVAPAPVISEKEKYDKRQEINTKSGDRILKYLPDSDVIARLLKIKKNEPLVTVEGGMLKESVAWAFQRAREIARGMGYDIMMNSGYRPPERQKELYDAAKPEDRGRLVAAPGDSWHQSGGAGDFSLVKIGSNESLTHISSKTDKPTKYTDILEYCMNRAGFVRYAQESWHCEIGSSEWADVMQKRGVIDKKSVLAYTFKKDRLGKHPSSEGRVA
jgi:LAS superfamily LD-carboxypeptidase LdcB